MMDEFKVVEIMNETMLELLKEKNQNFNINLKIREFLKDEAFFFILVTGDEFYPFFF